mgnify:CR=1 FL=1
MIQKIIFTYLNATENSYRSIPKTARQGTMVVGIINCLAAGLGILIINKFGRKQLLFNGMIGMAASLSLLGK